jgi:hypothetical protein
MQAVSNVTLQKKIIWRNLFMSIVSQQLLEIQSHTANMH